MGFGLGSALGVGGGVLGAYAGNKSASSERAAYGAAADDIRAGKEEALGYQKPYADFGKNSLSPLSALLFGKSYDPKTGESSTLSQDDRMSNFLQSPGYQFRLSEGLRSIEKGQAAKGNLLSGGGMKELQTFGQGQASDEYGNYLKSLFEAAGIGERSAANQSNIATGAATNLSNASLGAGMANANKYANLSNFGYGLAGMGAGSALQSEPNLLGGGGGGGGGGPASAAGSGGGRYNPSYFQTEGMSSLAAGLV